jgi:hypothetical protein
MVKEWGGGETIVLPTFAIREALDEHACLLKAAKDALDLLGPPHEAIFDEDASRLNELRKSLRAAIAKAEVKP